ncbi:MAG TPA: endonuclease/exonuclease/phosphatase family protein [Candidatus Paceibacterota bacterium]|nr:endonuclease/exonuclease/phosphatase family protein [Candidatus Paceibacterota bacterium]
MSTKIKIATLNLQSGVATTRGLHDFFLTGWRYWLPHSDAPIRQAGEILKKEGIQIAGVTEISEPSLRGGSESQLKVLSGSSDLAETHFYSSQKYGKFFFYEGNALLTQFPIKRFDSHRIYNKLMRMALEEGAIDVGGQKMSVFICHLALQTKNRRIQIGEIIEVLKDRSEPLILMGDFNTRKDKEARDLEVLLQKTPLNHCCSLPTYPSWNPKQPRDYIFLSHHFRSINCYIPKAKAFSDHLMLVVETELSD